MAIPSTSNDGPPKPPPEPPIPGNLPDEFKTTIQAKFDNIKTQYDQVYIKAITNAINGSTDIGKTPVLGN